jgi:regulator of protease activity HflC (stomatin/prohibitin superfamily)
MIGSFLLPADVEFATRRWEPTARRDVGHAAGPVSGARSLGERFMLFARRVVVRTHERALLYKDGEFAGLLMPGTYRFIGALRRCEVERFDIGRPAFEHPLVNQLIATKRAEIVRAIEIVETGPNEVAFVFYDERVAAILGPAERRLYWKGAVTIRVERFALRGAVLDARALTCLVGANDSQGLAHADAERAVGARVVRDGHVGLLYVDGKLTATLRPGLHAFWRYRGTVEVDLVDVRVRLLELPPQHILTRDKVPLRVGVAASYRLVDAARVARTLQDPTEHLRNEIRLGLRVAVGGRALDGLLEDRVAIDRTMTRRVAKRVADHGIAIRAVGLTDIAIAAAWRTRR